MVEGDFTIEFWAYMEQVTYFNEYSHKDPETGDTYHPYFVIEGSDKGKWKMHNWPITVAELGWLCDIPEDELIILKLKYGK